MSGIIRSLLRLQALEFAAEYPPEANGLPVDPAEEIRQLRTQIPAHLLELYDARKRRYHESSMVPVHERCCGGCHLSLSVRTRRMADDGLAECEHCARILYSSVREHRGPVVYEVFAA